jgi:hypothetical protein
MLELVLDKEFVNTFHLAYNGNDDYVDDFRDFFIKKLKRLTLVSNYADLEDIITQSQDNPLLELIIECIPKLDFRADLLNEINSKDFPLIGSPFKLILTGEKNEVCNYRRKRFGLEFLNPTILSDRWQLHYSRRQDINRKTTDDSEIPAEQRFDSWGKIMSFAHPLNSIILIDRYLLKWKTEKEFEKNLKNNILPIFKYLLLEASFETPIEIMIVSEFEEPAQKDKVELSQITLETLLKENTQRVIYLNILAYKKSSSNNINPIHDRIIITNYFYIESGAGFKIFNNNGFRVSIETNTEVKFRSILNIQNIFSAFFDLKQLGIYCKKKENDPGRPDTLNFFPSKTNRLLNIEHS